MIKSVGVLAVVLCALVCVSQAYVFEQSGFQGLDGWVESTHKGADAGEWKFTAGEYYGDAELDSGLKTGEDARFYQVSRLLDEEFSNAGKNLVLQYSVKHEQSLDCGGGYLKLLPKEGLDQADFNGDSLYNIMFGPDICGSSTKKVHFIMNYKGENQQLKKVIPAKTDQLTHVYTLVIKADQTYQVLIDQEEVAAGDLVEDFDFLPPKEIKDPAQSKPADWVDEEFIDDPEDQKPAGWDDIPQYIVDPEAEQPEDWDEELDGEYEAPLVPNPEYEGEWEPNQIPNPAYKGEWVHPLIANPAYEHDDNIYAYESHAALGIEVWQVRSGTIFNNFLVTDDIELAAEKAQAVIARASIEKDAKDAADEAERQRAEEERLAAEAEAASEEEEDDEDWEDDEEEDDEEE
jgi:calreticulin